MPNPISRNAKLVTAIFGIALKGLPNLFPFWGAWLLAGLASSPLPARAADGEIALAVRHHHAIGSCRGTLILDSHGARYETDHKEDSRTWAYDDIKQWQVENSGRIKIYTYEDRKWRLGADQTFEFDFLDQKMTAEQVYDFLQAHTSRPIAAWLHPSEIGRVLYEFPLKHLASLTGSQGRLLFTERAVLYQSDRKEANRTWRYEDLESIASAGRYDLTLTTYEEQRFHYGSRRVYNFQLKQSLPPETYDELWRFVNHKKGLGLFEEGKPGQMVR